MSKLMDNLFICSSIIFNIAVSVVYIASKLDNIALLQVAGAVVICLILPFTITLVGFIKEKEEKKTIISLVFILFYLFFELFLDYIFVIPFRDIPAIHIPYILSLYAALFSMIGVSFDKNRKMGFVVLITFFILIGCLIFMLIG